MGTLVRSHRAGIGEGACELKMTFAYNMRRLKVQLEAACGGETFGRS